MKKSIPLYLYGLIIIAEGVFLFFSMFNSFSMLKYTLGIGLLIGSIFAFLTALTRQKRQVQFAYHELHALTMLVYGVSILVFCNRFETLLFFTAFLFFFYAFSEFIFCFWLFNLKQKVVYKVIFVRLFIGLLTGIGTFVSMNYTNVDNMKAAIAVFGLLFFIVGLNIILYVPVMKRRELDEI